jgi:hypothetical protein
MASTAPGYRRFAWNGTTYRSLTEIAFAMTGTPERVNDFETAQC